MNPAALLQEFVNQFGQSLEMMSGDQPGLRVADAAHPSPPEGWICWEQPFATVGIGAWLAAPEENWIQLGGALLRAAGVEEIEAETAKSTFTEVLSQAFSGTGRTIGAQLQTDLNAPPGKIVSEVPGGQSWNRIETKVGDIEVSLDIAFSEGLLELLSGPQSNSGHELSPAIPERVAHPAIENSRTLELLLDVELPVSVSFGRAQLPLRDVIKLTTGSIVELNRTISEPVEVIVNNCVIARGEVVVVEGNFGVRIHEVISKQDRLRTLY